MVLPSKFIIGNGNDALNLNNAQIFIDCCGEMMMLASRRETTTTKTFYFPPSRTFYIKIATNTKYDSGRGGGAGTNAFAESKPTAKAIFKNQVKIWFKSILGSKKFPKYMSSSPKILLLQYQTVTAVGTKQGTIQFASLKRT